MDNVRLYYTNYVTQDHPVYLRFPELLCAVGEILAGCRWGSSNRT